MASRFFKSTIQKKKSAKEKRELFFFCVFAFPFFSLFSPHYVGMLFFYFYSPMGVMGAPDDRAAPYMGEG